MGTILLAILAAATLAVSAITEPSPATCTPAQLASRVRRAGWTAWARWAIGLLFGAPAVTIWYAARAAIHLATYGLSLCSARVASVTAMDGRTIRITRSEWIRA